MKICNCTTKSIATPVNCVSCPKDSYPESEDSEQSVTISALVYIHIAQTNVPHYKLMVKSEDKGRFLHLLVNS